MQLGVEIHVSAGVDITLSMEFARNVTPIADTATPH